MGRTTIAPENRPGGGVERPPMLKMTAKDQRMRVALWDIQVMPDGRRLISPWSDWVHTLKAPEIENGVALKKKVKQRDGSEVLKWTDDFIGQHICLGDEAILAEKGRDPDNCPTCAACKAMQTEFQGESYTPWDAEIRYAMNVIIYSTRPGGLELANPPGAQILVWGFGASRFNRLDDLSRVLANEQVSDGKGGSRPKGLIDVDIALGPCEDVSYQRYNIDRLDGLPAWAQSPTVMQYLQELWFGQNGANRYGDPQLQAACGRLQTNRAYLEADIQKGMNAWRTALRRGGAAATADPLGAAFNGSQGQQDMTTGLEELAQQQAPAQPAPVGMVDPFAPPGQALQQAVAPEMAQAAAAQQAVLAAAGALVDPFQGTNQPGGAVGPAPAASQPVVQPAAVVTDPFGGLGMDQFAPQQPAQAQPAPVQPVEAIPPGVPSGSLATSPPAQPATPSAPPQAAPSPAPAIAAGVVDPFAVPAPPQQAQPGQQEPMSFDELTKFT